MGVKLNTAGLQRIIAGLPGAMDEADEATAGHIADLASQFAPKDSGDLSDSVIHEPSPEGGWRVVAGRGLPDERAPAQEYGTIYQPAQPYMTPAAKEISAPLEYAKAIAKLVSGSGT